MIYILPLIFSLYRLVCLPFFIYFLVKDEMVISLIILILAALSDIFDGALARRLNLESKFGALMDATGDKIFVFGALCGVVYLKAIPWWFLAAVFLKDLVIICGSLILHLVGRRMYFLPTVLGKSTTAFVFATLVAALLYIYGLVTFGFVWVWVWITTIVVVLSCLDYLIVGYDILKGKEILRNIDSIMYSMLSDRFLADDPNMRWQKVGMKKKGEG